VICKDFGRKWLWPNREISTAFVVERDKGKARRNPSIDIVSSRRMETKEPVGLED